MLKAGLSAVTNKITHRFGVHLHRWPSDTHLLVEYPVRRAPRYGYGKPPHPHNLSDPESRRGAFEEVLNGFAGIMTLLDSIPLRRTRQRSTRGLTGIRSGSALGMPQRSCISSIERSRPSFFEIGSRNVDEVRASRDFLSDPCQQKSLRSTHSHARKSTKSATAIVRGVLQDVDLPCSMSCEAGDVLSFDGSHILFMDSDVSVFFLDVLPRLKPGVLVHVHDIFWPVDYPRAGARVSTRSSTCSEKLILAGEARLTSASPTRSSTSIPTLRGEGARAAARGSSSADRPVARYPEVRACGRARSGSKSNEPN